MYESNRITKIDKWFIDPTGLWKGAEDLRSRWDMCPLSQAFLDQSGRNFFYRGQRGAYTSMQNFNMFS